jgi:fructose-1-phosphate kinase PfkB-like protein
MHREHNPTGAGDALVAGLVWALDRSYALPDALVWGVACGAAAASLDGTGVGSGALVARLRERVRLEEISG